MVSPATAITPKSIAEKPIPVSNVVSGSFVGLRRMDQWNNREVLKGKEY
jgi:hypothetical protein